MPKNVILVHGYSARNFATYGMLPGLLRGSGYTAQDVYLSAFDSLNDDITCDDLSNAFASRIADLEQAGMDIADTAIIAHSTGAIIVRRWILNRWAAGGKLPSHFLSLAGAHHGSSLAQLGTSSLAYLFRELNGGTSVGLEVLQDLDYGSLFLLKLNEDWLDAYLSPNPPVTLAFSLIGDDHGALRNQVFWQSREHGSDCTVRISGGNLNYKILSYDQTAPSPALTSKHLPYIVPHIVLNRISHTGDNGILGGNSVAMQTVYPFIKQALNTASKDDYASLAKSWGDLTAQWSADNPTQCYATILFSLNHPGGRNVDQSLILIKDDSDQNLGDVESVLSVSNALDDNQPISNAVTPSSKSFYVNYPKFRESYPHIVDIQIASGCPEIAYRGVAYKVLADDTGSVNPNEFVYVKVTLLRETKATYSLLPASSNPDLRQNWPPMPQPPL